MSRIFLFCPSWLPERPVQGFLPTKHTNHLFLESPKVILSPGHSVCPGSWTAVTFHETALLFFFWARLERSSVHMFMCRKDHLPQWNQNFILSSGGSVFTIISSFVIYHSWDVTQLILCCVDETLFKFYVFYCEVTGQTVTTWKLWMVGKRVFVLFLFLLFYILDFS